MTPASRARKPAVTQYLAQGSEAFMAGRFYLAAEAFAKAREIDGHNPAVLFNLAGAKERIGEIDAAALLLTEALRHKPGWDDAARRLAQLLGRYRIGNPGELEPHGLLAAFAFDAIDQKPIAAVALDYLLARSGLGAAVKEARAGRGIDAARGLILKRTDKALAHPLLIASLASSHNRNPDVERLLAPIRRVLLLEVPAERFEDKALTGFVLALIRQGMLNEHIFAIDTAESQHLSSHPLDVGAFLSGNPGEARRGMLHLLYRSPQELFGGGLPAGDFRAIRPRALGEMLTALAADDRKRAELAAGIPDLGPIQDATSKRVARQYEEHPYPRWTSIQLPREGAGLEALKAVIPPERLGFIDAPFKVLIAGCGTGQHALAAAMRYGADADVLAVDLSRASLAYAKSKAEHYGVKNLRFARADLLALGDGEGPFEIIEAVGVLHHMAEPFKGWQALLDRLRPGGLMSVGLYSAIARETISQLRSEADFPGPECASHTARLYRQRLMGRSDEAARGLVQSLDFYSLSEFRDLVLHEHERPILLSEIEAFLAANGLVFRGFQLPTPILHSFPVEFPADGLPGTLANWAVFEERHPRTFDAMYRFWCEKVG